MQMWKRQRISYKLTFFMNPKDNFPSLSLTSSYFSFTQWKYCDRFSYDDIAMMCADKVGFLDLLLTFFTLLASKEIYLAVLYENFVLDSTPRVINDTSFFALLFLDYMQNRCKHKFIISSSSDCFAILLSTSFS